MYNAKKSKETHILLVFKTKPQLNAEEGCCTFLCELEHNCFQNALDAFQNTLFPSAEHSCRFCVLMRTFDPRSLNNVRKMTC